MLKNIKIVQYFGGIIAAFWVSFGTLALLAWLGLGSAANSLLEVHGYRMRKADQLAQMADQATRNRMEILLMFQHDPSGQLAGVHDTPPRFTWTTSPSGAPRSSACGRRCGKASQMRPSRP